MRLFKSFLLTSTSQAISIVASLATRVLLARFMGPANYGGFGVGVNAVTLLYKVFSIGIVPSAQYHGSKVNSDYAVLMRTVLIVSIVISLLILLMGLIVVPWALSSYWQKQSIGYEVYRMFVQFVPMLLIGDVLCIVLIPMGKIHNYATIQLLGAILMPILFAVSLFWFVPLTAAIACQILVWILVFIYSLWLLRGILVRGKIDISLVKNAIKYGFRTWPNVILGIGTARISILFGAAIVSEEKIGYYIVAMNVVEGIFRFHSSFGQLLLSKVSEQEEESFGIVQKSMRLSFTLFIIISVLYLGFGKPAISLCFGDVYYPAFTLSLILLGSALAHALHRVLSNFLAGMGMPSRNTITLTCEMLVLVITVPFLTTMFDVYGLALASTLSALIALGVSTFQSIKVMKCSALDLYWLRKDDIYNLGKQIKLTFLRKGGMF